MDLLPTQEYMSLHSQFCKTLTSEATITAQLGQVVQKKQAADPRGGHLSAHSASFQYMCAATEPHWFLVPAPPSLKVGLAEYEVTGFRYLKWKKSLLLAMQG